MALPGGGYVIVWQTNITYEDIAARIYDANGAPVTGEFVVNSYTTVGQYTPSVTTLTDGSFVVSWMAGGMDGDGGIAARRFSATGTPIGNDFLVNTTTAGPQNQPGVAALSDGGFVISWQSQGQDGSGFGVYGQRYNAAGAKVGTEFRVNEFSTSNQQNVTLAGRPDGGFVVAWDSDGQDGSGTGVYSRVYTPNMLPGAVNDILGTEGADTINAGIGPAKVQGLGGNDSIVGTAYSDTLIGGSGNDTLDGGTGADTLTGGAGADRFIVDEGDTVPDFLAAEGDKFDLSGLDADRGTAGSQPFTWIDNGAFTNVAGELRWAVMSNCWRIATATVLLTWRSQSQASPASQMPNWCSERQP